MVALPFTAARAATPSIPGIPIKVAAGFAVEVQTKDGESYTGRIGDQNDEEILLKADLLNPASIRRVKWADIESVVPSTLSLMPVGLLNVFTQDEILDLIAYLKSGRTNAPGTP